MQVILKWTIQSGVAVVPRSGSKEHIIENLQLFDFTLDDSDMEAIDGMNENYPCDTPRTATIHVCRNVAFVQIYSNLLDRWSLLTHGTVGTTGTRVLLPSLVSGSQHYRE